MRCLADEAAWQASQDYDASRGQPLAQFVRGRVLSAALKRYRQEWAYAYHCALATSSPLGPATDCECRSYVRDDVLNFALARLPSPDRWILEQLCALGRTEVDVGGELGISHQAVSKRKRHAIEVLRARVKEPED